MLALGPVLSQPVDALDLVLHELPVQVGRRPLHLGDVLGERLALGLELLLGLGLRSAERLDLALPQLGGELDALRAGHEGLRLGFPRRALDAQRAPLNQDLPPRPVQGWPPRHEPLGHAPGLGRQVDRRRVQLVAAVPLLEVQHLALGDLNQRRLGHPLVVNVAPTDVLDQELDPFVLISDGEQGVDGRLHSVVGVVLGRVVVGIGVGVGVGVGVVVVVVVVVVLGAVVVLGIGVVVLVRSINGLVLPPPPEDGLDDNLRRAILGRRRRIPRLEIVVRGIIVVPRIPPDRSTTSPLPAAPLAPPADASPAPAARRRHHVARLRPPPAVRVAVVVLVRVFHLAVRADPGPVFDHLGRPVGRLDALDQLLVGRRGVRRRARIPKLERLERLRRQPGILGLVVRRRHSLRRQRPQHLDHIVQVLGRRDRLPGNALWREKHHGNLQGGVPSRRHADLPRHRSPPHDLAGPPIVALHLGPHQPARIKLWCRLLPRRLLGMMTVMTVMTVMTYISGPTGHPEQRLRGHVVLILHRAALGAQPRPLPAITPASRPARPAPSAAPPPPALPLLGISLPRLVVSIHGSLPLTLTLTLALLVVVVMLLHLLHLHHLLLQHELLLLLQGKLLLLLLRRQQLLLLLLRQNLVDPVVAQRLLHLARVVFAVPEIIGARPRIRNLILFDRIGDSAPLFARAALDPLLKVLLGHGADHRHLGRGHDRVGPGRPCRRELAERHQRVQLRDVALLLRVPSRHRDADSCVLCLNGSMDSTPAPVRKASSGHVRVRHRDADSCVLCLNGSMDSTPTPVRKASGHV